MNKLSKYTFIFLVQFLFAGALISQDVMRIAGTQIVKKGETMTIEAGKLVQFEAGATLLVEGSLVVRGTMDKPVVFQSVDLQNPGNGVMVKGVEEVGSIVIENVRAEGLVQALRFDPFWYRKSVSLSGVTVSGSNSGEPVMYVAGPLLDLREGMDIQFSMTSMKFFNNTGSVLLEKVGSDGIVYSLDKLLFSENNLPGSDATMGILHLDVARTVSAGQLKIGELAFNRNMSGANSVGLSLSGGDGTGSEKLSAAAVYGEQVNALIYDNRVNSRVPSLEIAKVGGLDAYSEEKDFVVGAKHTFGKVVMNVVGNPRVVKMEDSLGRPVFNNANRLGDTLVLSYLEGNPTVITLANGQKFMVPKLTAAELPPPIYRKVDTVLLERIVKMNGEESKVDRLTLKLTLPIPMGGNHSKLDSLGTWEVGQWFGGAIYAGGDIKHKFSPMPSTVEYSYGLYLQKNVHTRFSYAIDYYHCRISMHNLLAPGLFSGGKIPEVITPSGFLSPVFSNTYQLMFVTPINSLSVSGLWHLEDNVIALNRKSNWLSTVGAGVGVMHFTPYRVIYRGRNGYNSQTGQYAESLADYNNRLWSDRANLRELGTEGQNFLPGKKRYSPITTFVNLSYRLTYNRSRWSFSGELKANLAYSDYLDDFGSGVYYGGNRQSVLNYANENLGYDKYDGSDISTILPEQIVVSSAQKSVNNMSDGFYQMHMGVAYHLSPNQNKKLDQFKGLQHPRFEIDVPTHSNWNSRQTARFDSTIKQNYPGFFKNVEVGTWMGAGMYVGDLKPKFFPMPSSMEMSLGVFVQVNQSPKTNWKFSYYNTGISAVHPSSVLLLSGVELPSISDLNGQQVVFPDWWLNFNTKMNIVDVDYIKTLGKKGYSQRISNRFALRSQVGFGLGFGTYQVFKVLNYGSSQMIDLRKYGIEGERMKGAKNKFSNNFGLASGSYILTLFSNRWTIKGEIKGAITTSDKLDGYSNGLWFGGDIDQWYESTDEMPNSNGIKVNSTILKKQYEDMVAAGMPLQQQRAKNRLPDGYIQFHLGIGYRF